MNKIFLSCREITENSALGEVPHLSVGKKIKFRLHIQMCKACRAYHWMMTKMGREVRSDFGEYEKNYQHEIEKAKKGLKKNL